MAARKKAGGQTPEPTNRNHIGCSCGILPVAALLEFIGFHLPQSSTVDEQIVIYTDGTMTLSLPAMMNVLAWCCIPPAEARNEAEPVQSSSFAEMTGLSSFLSRVTDDNPIVSVSFSDGYSSLAPEYRWVTDITYIITPQRTYYLCAIMDLCGRYIVAYRLGTEINATLVSDTVRDAFAHEKGKVADGLLLHSDQGCQYTSEE